MHKVRYMEWVKLRPRARYEIGGSGMVPVLADELPEARAAFALSGFNLYGYRPLVERIAARYQVDPDQVVTTQGCSMANYLSCAAVLQAGDEVLVEAPAYEPLLDVPQLLGATIQRFERRFENGFQIDVDEIAEKLTPRTKLVVLSNLHNPSGVLTSAEKLIKIGELARRVGAWVLNDEVYLDFLFQAVPPSSVHLGPNFMVTSSLTKCYGFDGLRCGWILAPPQMAKTIWRLQDFFGVNGAIPAEITSACAFEHLERFVARTRGIIEGNRPLVERFVEDHARVLEWIRPDAGPVCFPKVNRAGAERFADILRSDYETVVIPGAFFERPQHFRLGFGGQQDELAGGLQRLGEALQA